MQETEHEEKIAVDSQSFAGFVVALEGRSPEINSLSVNHHWALCSEFVFEELLSTLEDFDAPPLHLDASLIDDESRRRVHDIEKRPAT
jgi:hypothetical protein